MFVWKLFVLPVEIEIKCTSRLPVYIRCAGVCRSTCMYSGKVNMHRIPWYACSVYVWLFNPLLMHPIVASLSFSTFYQSCS